MHVAVKISIIAVALLNASLAYAITATSNNTVTLQWQGNIPVQPSTAGSWKFVNSADPSKTFTPGVSTITVTPGSNGIQTLTLSPVSFGIKANTGGLTANSAVKVYLASPITFSGLNPSSSVTESDKPTMNLKVGSTTIALGSSSAVNAATIGGTAANADITITGSGSVGATAYTPGDTMTVASVLVFTADVG